MTDKNEFSRSWRGQGNGCMRAIRPCFIFSFVLAINMLQAQQPQNATPSQPVQKNPVNQQPPAKTATVSPAKSAGAVNGAKTETKASNGIPQKTADKTPVKRTHHRRRVAAPVQKVEVINGTTTKTEVFKATPKGGVAQKARNGRGATGKSASAPATVEVINGEKTQTVVFGRTPPKGSQSKAGKTHSSTKSSASPGVTTVEVINGATTQTKVFRETPQKPVHKTAPKPADAGSGPK